ncbi:FdtA/QdtA family cupin domain-containing protein [Sphingomonas sp. BN140010]|uniref:FdtA/QdtA family cupin domain-containing protein n=1 Tax=Sphingomonas arvum TaxID=2992113 RepID=A0ABT3JEZ6_9SPHN|nr:FdtA/QdtA family cupin domain-containing protein [Sphingomonas sp. BN140010]MCW3797509.1 FdtA/QdtA family cupin domain-containing protein [Sphingomonas sp. BN140010]
MHRAEHEILTGCRLLPLMVRGDERGSLVPIEAGITVPFDVKRVYTVFGTLPGVSRGFHAHLRLQQLVVAVCGACTMMLDDGSEKRDVPLDRPDVGLTIGPMVWHEMHNFTPDCVLMVLADAHYDEADYIRDYDRFMALVGTINA